MSCCVPFPFPISYIFTNKRGRHLSSSSCIHFTFTTWSWRRLAASTSHSSSCDRSLTSNLDNLNYYNLQADHIHIVNAMADPRFDPSLDPFLAALSMPFTGAGQFIELVHPRELLPSQEMLRPRQMALPHEMLPHQAMSPQEMYRTDMSFNERLPNQEMSLLRDTARHQENYPADLLCNEPRCAVIPLTQDALSSLGRIRKRKAPVTSTSRIAVPFSPFSLVPSSQRISKAKSMY